MSDLQCAATLLLTGVRDEQHARALVTSLQDRHLAVVYFGGGTPAERAAGLVAHRLGVPARPEPGLADDGRVRVVLEELADMHRGETVLVVADAAGLDRALGLARLGTAGRNDAAGDVVELRIDADGWAVAP